jgi:hypothetical protein
MAGIPFRIKECLSFDEANFSKNVANPHPSLYFVNLHHCAKRLLLTAVGIAKLGSSKREEG